MRPWEGRLHENADMPELRAQRERNAQGCRDLLKLLHEHHPEFAPSNPIKVEPISVEPAAPDPTTLAQSGALTPPESAAPPPPPIWVNPIRTIIKVTAQHFRIPDDWMTPRRQRRDIVRIRQIAMYLCYTMTAMSMPKIAISFGHCDHTTILHAIRQIEKKIPADQVLAADVVAIRESAMAQNPLLRPKDDDDDDAGHLLDGCVRVFLTSKQRLYLARMAKEGGHRGVGALVHKLITDLIEDDAAAEGTAA